MMKPTVGRVVYYNEGTKEEPKVAASIISYVWKDDRVNLMVIDVNGKTYGKTNVVRGEEGGQWDWMPYQKANATNSQSAEPRP